MALSANPLSSSLPGDLVLWLDRADPRQPFAIVRPPRLQLRAEDLLEVGEAGIADGLGEADQGRWLDMGLGGNAGDGAEGDLVRVLQMRRAATWTRRFGRLSRRAIRRCP